jgi:2-dehydro-3-deoxygluconokinase
MKKIVTLGEIMLRFSTEEGIRLSQASGLSVHYGGAEANVAVSMANFGYESFFAGKVPDNPLGQGAERHLNANGVRTDFLIKGGDRLGIYYLESGTGERSAKVTYDRKHSSFSELVPEEADLDSMLKSASLFHVSGITLALSPELRELVLLALKKAKEYGVLTSLDFNYRGKLWSQSEAGAAIKELLPFADICSCGELDSIHILGLEPADASLSQTERLQVYYDRLVSQYPGIRFICSTFRKVISASCNTLQGNLYSGGQLFQSKVHSIEPIVDRVGGGDAFMAGVLAGVLEGWDSQMTADFAAAASALKHTIHGDSNSFTKEEVLALAENEPGKILR